ncbi:MAG: hypothetical protein M1570_01725 [Chloroflexi bacterium]|nr:hypothetical protein [Chloroflexota bacterium]
MQIALVFDDWRGKNRKSIYHTEKGVELSMGDFHSGTVFMADIQLDEDSARELEAALSGGYIPVFYAVEISRESNSPKGEGFGQSGGT